MKLRPDNASEKQSRGILVASLYAAVLLGAGFLLFHNLAGRLLWGDESEAAVLAKNVLKYGYPRTEDGLNHITLYGATTDNIKANVWTWSPWLQEYLAASSFKLFGATTWAARAPFALFGWLSVALLCFTGHRVYHNHWVTLSSTTLLATSEVFLLHSRQCRYYAVCVFCEILLMFAVYLLFNRNRQGVLWLALALSLQFYSNYIVAAANLPVVLAVAVILFREDKKLGLWLAAGLGFFALVILPWLIYAELWRQIGLSGDHYTPWQKIIYYLSTFQFYFVPLAFALLPLAGWVVRRIRQQRVANDQSHTVEIGPKDLPTRIQSRWEMFLVCLVPSYIVALLISPGCFTRYLLPVLPVGCLLVAVWVFRYVRWKTVAVAIILFQCTCNGISIVTGIPFGEKHPWRFPLAEYIRGFGHYEDRFADVLAFLKKESHPGETVFVMDPENPIIFYTGLRVLDGTLLDKTLPDPLPDWILTQSASGTIDQTLDLSPGLASHYERIILSVPDTDRIGSVPRPEVFQYETAKNRVPLVIYKKKINP
ncbi:MAG TPA: glycosyltransferase family 39 protein [Verrucomicrobiae bacterium]|nr:glycosyltransferase family 39 protein [Verrucomicrobiae bacterium]